MDAVPGGSRGPREEANANMMEYDQMAVELEEEFQWLCGEEAQVESIKVCNRVGRAIKNIEVLVMAEVAKSMRCGYPSRAAIEEVGRMATEAAMSELGTLRAKCKESAVVEKWVQESVRAQQSKLAELRELKRRLAEQERELLQMRRAVATGENAVPEPAEPRQRGQSKDGGNGREDCEQGDAMRAVEEPKRRLLCGARAADPWEQPHMDEAALDAERAQLLYEQLAHWHDSYHLMEALGSDNHACDKLKQTALRIERRNWTLRNTGMVVRAGRGNSREPNKPKPIGSAGEQNEPKHTKEEPRRQHVGGRKGGIKERNNGGEERPCPLIGPKHITTVETFGRKWTGLLDTGSEISILPATVLLAAKEDGYDIDREVVEHRMDLSMDLLRVAPEEIDDEPVKARRGGNREGPTARATPQACETLPTDFFGVKNSSNAETRGQKAR
ncbi:unnamed protein product [Heligmosomoides polygyrus]|uniref:Peptidase A2 domain-containing protein n=1 Tax=Heligmosomoides polygyrus TaxID=6339 RepID=A0A183FUN4_HELPZ|nr:unnamed protein product [Heligmosomoides polygyrus]